MSSSLDYFSRGLAKALERRAKEKTLQQTIQTVQKAAADVATSAKASDAIITTQLDHDELYRTNIIQKMLNHIKSKRNPV